jgi:ATP-binding cassette, subfamily B, bacterial MsbA
MHKEAKVFWRIFKFVWQQWPQLIGVVGAALLIAILFGLSFMTVLPLLKVMMSEEGLHGWVDRKSSNLRYGFDFYVPDRSDLLGQQDMIYYLRVTRVDEDSVAARSGVRLEDRIVQVGPPDSSGRMGSPVMLERLALAADGAVVPMTIQRPSTDGGIQTVSLNLTSLPRPDQVRADQMRWFKRVQWLGQWNVVRFSQWAVSHLSRTEPLGNKARSVKFIILAMMIVTSIRCVATFTQKFLAEQVVQTTIACLRREIFSHVMIMPVGFFTRTEKGTSDTVSRILGDTASAGKGVKILLGNALREPLKAMVGVTAAMLIDWKLTLIFIAAAPPTVGLMSLLGKKMRRASKQALMSSARMLGKLEGSVSALRVVKVYNQQGHEVTAFDGINRSFLRRVMRIEKVDAATGPLMEFFGMIAGSAALLVGAQWVCGPNPSMQASEFFTLLLLLGTSAESVRKVSDVWNRVQEANAACERVYEVIDAPSEKEKPNASVLSVPRKTIEFRDVSFIYPDTDKTVLNKVNLTVTVGKTVAVVGPNGSGKTTLINLIPRFYDPSGGAVLIDGIDIQDVTLSSLRDQIAMVTQNVVTFNDTLAANIAYGRPDATREEIIEAAKRSYAHEFIAPLPDGYDTVIGEHGSGFSGGQLQRIVIARAILKNPAILIFDEAMSQIDADSESKIQKALAGLINDRTCFIIAHRFSTVIGADRIVVMDNGQIIAQGRHDELTKTCKLYQNLYETQLLVAD